jgi:hypothetical protein
MTSCDSASTTSRQSWQQSIEVCIRLCTTADTTTTTREEHSVLLLNLASIIIMMTPNSNDCDSPIDRNGSCPETAVHPEEEENRVCSATMLPVEVVHERTVLPVCQALYADSGNNKTMLSCVLAIGIKKNDDTPLFAIDEEPWCSLTKQRFCSPTNTDLVKEI